MTERNSRRPAFAKSLSARLLALTVLFVMLAELLIYTPSIARFRKTYLEEHIAKAQIAALAVEAAPNMRLGSDLEMELLINAGAYGVVLRKPDLKVLALRGDMPPEVDVTFDLREDNFLIWIRDAFEALLQDKNRVMRVMGVSPKDPSVMIEVILDEASMQEEMIAFSERILQLSIVISLITAGLVYFSLQLLMVRPMRRITESMVSFRDNPEGGEVGPLPSRRGDEIGVAQRELAAMQHELRLALQQKNRLAALGAAVAKINHDLRNSLATAVLVSDRLAHIDDPEVQRMTPRLYDAIDRAVTLCSQTLMYARDPRPALKPQRFLLAELVAEVGAVTLSSPLGARLDWQNAVSPLLDVEADRDQLFRVVDNLAKNAAEAGARRVRIEASVSADGHIHVDVADDGPGLPEKARANLFKPFAGSARDGGTGLGLVIAHEIMVAHGGTLSLIDGGAAGTTFRLTLPARARLGETSGAARAAARAAAE